MSFTSRCGHLIQGYYAEITQESNFNWVNVIYVSAQPKGNKWMQAWNDGKTIQGWNGLLWTCIEISPEDISNGKRVYFASKQDILNHLLKIQHPLVTIVSPLLLD
jgi:hypothetical protein